MWHMCCGWILFNFASHWHWGHWQAKKGILDWQSLQQSSVWLPCCCCCCCCRVQRVHWLGGQFMCKSLVSSSFEVLSYSIFSLLWQSIGTTVQALSNRPLCQTESRRSYPLLRIFIFSPVLRGKEGKRSAHIKHEPFSRLFFLLLLLIIQPFCLHFVNDDCWCNSVLISGTEKKKWRTANGWTSEWVGDHELTSLVETAWEVFQIRIRRRRSRSSVQVAKQSIYSPFWQYPNRTFCVTLF